VNVAAFEFRSGVRTTTWRFWIEYDFGACLSRIDTKQDRLAKEKTFCQRVLFQLLSLLAEHCNDCAISLEQYRNGMYSRLVGDGATLPLLPPGFCRGLAGALAGSIQMAEKAHYRLAIYINYPLEITAASVRLPNPGAKLKARRHGGACTKRLTSSKKEL